MRYLFTHSSSLFHERTVKNRSLRPPTLQKGWVKHSQFWHIWSSGTTLVTHPYIHTHTHTCGSWLLSEILLHMSGDSAWIRRSCMSAWMWRQEWDLHTSGDRRRGDVPVFIKHVAIAPLCSASGLFLWTLNRYLVKKNWALFCLWATGERQSVWP